MLAQTLALLLAAAGTLASADDVLSRVAAHADRFGALSRQIWENPELGFHENKSSALLQQELRADGFTVASGVAGMPTAFTATFGSGKPVIGILGEFDALPGLSQKDVPELDPVQAGAPGHGCGHNLLGSASALAAVAIKEEMQARGLKGTIRYYGTPAEEGGGGKIYMLHAGLFRDVDAVLAWHPGDSNRVNLGSSTAINGGWFRFYGVASHAAAAPDRGRSALDVLAGVLGRAMQKAGGYQFSTDERQFAGQIQKTLGAPVHSPGPDQVVADQSTAGTSASTDATSGPRGFRRVGNRRLTTRPGRSS